MSDDTTTSGAPQNTLPVPRPSRVKPVLLGAVLLMSGIVIGSGLTLIGLKWRADEFRSRPDMFSNRILSKMEDDLNLTKEQKAELSKIFKAAREDLDDVRRQHRAQAQSFFREFHDDVAKVLTVKQQTEWEEWWKRARERAFKDRGGRVDPADPMDGMDLAVRRDPVNGVVRASREIRRCRSQERRAGRLASSDCRHHHLSSNACAF